MSQRIVAVPSLMWYSLRRILLSTVRNLIEPYCARCGCPSDSCYPLLGSDHKLITFQIVLPLSALDAASPAWPGVRDWRPVVRALRPRLTDWSTKVSDFCRDGSHYFVDTHRAILDVLHAEFVHMCWDTANQVDSSRCRNRRPQLDWWDDECFDAMVSREYFRALRLQFHHFVRRKKKPRFGMVG